MQRWSSRTAGTSSETSTSSCPERRAPERARRPGRRRAGRLAGCACISSTAPTSSSATSSRRRPATPTAARGRRAPRGVVVGPRHARGRRDPRRRGHRPRHRVVPQRALARLQDRRGHRPGAAGAVPAARGRARARSASRCGRWWSSRPTTRWPRRRRWPPSDPRVEQVIICTPDKDLGQCVARQAVVQLDRRAGQHRSTRPGCGRSSGCRRRRSPTGWRSSGTAPTASPGCRGWGAQSASTVLAHYGHLEGIPDDVADWDPDLRSAVRGAAGWPTRWRPNGSRPSCSGSSPPSASTRPCWTACPRWQWRGPTADFDAVCRHFGDPRLAERTVALAGALSSAAAWWCRTLRPARSGPGCPTVRRCTTRADGPASTG